MPPRTTRSKPATATALSRPSRAASTAARQAISTTAESAAKEDAEEDGEEGADVVSTSGKKRKATKGKASEDEADDDHPAYEEDDDHFDDEEAEPSSDDASEPDLSPPPKPVKRARKTPPKKSTTKAADTPSSSTAQTLAKDAADLAESTAELTDALSSPATSVPSSTPSKPADKKKAAPQKKKEPVYELDADGNPVVGEDGQLVEKKPKPRAKPKPKYELDEDGNPKLDEDGKPIEKPKVTRKKKVKEVIIYDVPEVEKRQTTFKGRLGYACLNSLLREQNPRVFCSRTLRLASLIAEDGPQKLEELTTQNTVDLLTILKWNAENNIKLFRLSSEMFPFASHPEHGYKIAERLPIAAANLAEAGKFARENDMRITAHPGQWTQLASPRETVFENAVRDLEYHCQMMDCMGMDKESIMVIHMGGVYGDKETTLERFVENYAKIPPHVQQRLVLENDEICYSADDLLPICQKLSIPFVFDYHHDWINPSRLPPPLMMDAICDTWKPRGIRVKQHLSEARPGAKTVPERRGHSDRCDRLPLGLKESIPIAKRQMERRAVVERVGTEGNVVLEEGEGKVKDAADVKMEEKDVGNEVGEGGVLAGEVLEEAKPTDEDGLEITEFGIRMGLPDDVDLMIEAKDKEQAVLHLYNVYDLFPVHRGSYVPPKPPAEPSATTDEDDPEAPLPRDKDGNPIELTPMAKAKRAKAKAKVVAGRKREAREEKKRLEAVADGEVLEEERVDADKIAPVKKGKGKGKGKAAAAGVKSETDGDEEVVPPAPKKQSTPAKRAKAEREEGEGAKKPAVKKPRVTKKAAATAAKEKAQEGAVSGFGDGADSDLSEMEE